MALNVSNHNGMLSTDHFLDLKAIQEFCTQQNSFDKFYIYLPRFNSKEACTSMYVIDILAYSAVI